MATGSTSQGPQIVRHGPYPELTWTAIIMGWVIGAVIAVSIAYAALILGFSIEGSELAAILGWGVLRGVMRRSSILENNINQTIASAVNGASSGIMFTVPALFILAKSQGLESVDDFDLNSTLLIILAGITGCILGLAFVIPLRKQMIDFDRLAYPGGIAVATILKSPGAGLRKAVLLLGATAFAGVVQLIVLRTLGEEADWHLGDRLGISPMWNITFYLSIMTIGVGYLSGKGGFWFGAGGFVCYWILSPILVAYAEPGVQQLAERPGEAVFFASLPDADSITVKKMEVTYDPSSLVPQLYMGEEKEVRDELYRPTGIGMLIGAAIGGIIAAFPLIRTL